jgi:hypothetical protein
MIKNLSSACIEAEYMRGDRNSEVTHATKHTLNSHTCIDIQNLPKFYLFLQNSVLLASGLHDEGCCALIEA